MKFWEALKLMQENPYKTKCRMVRWPEIYYYYGDVLDIPCLKDSNGAEVFANSCKMNNDWELVPDAT